jgi:SAM-dependent methyltransferase
VTIDPAAQSFASVAGVYERARPEYPEAAVDWLASRLDLGPGRTVVDLAAGTGKLTRMLVPTRARVIAVEPVPEMLAELRRAAPEAQALQGTAEAIPLPDAGADAVTVAQAFHWFDPPRALREIARVLRPGGRLGLIWNTLRRGARGRAAIRPPRARAAARGAAPGPVRVPVRDAGVRERHEPACFTTGRAGAFAILSR